MSASAQSPRILPAVGALTRSRAVDDLLPDDSVTRQSESPMQIAMRRLRADKLAIGAATIFLLMVFLCVSAGWMESHWAHRTYIEQNLSGKVHGTEVIDLRGMPQVGPGMRRNYTLGADPLGRDLFMRVLRGGQVSLRIALGAAIITMIGGLALGLLAGFKGGKSEMFLANVIDVWLAFPSVLFAIALSTALANSDGFWIVKRGSMSLQMLIIGGLGIAYFARLVMVEARTLREREYVEAARALGATDGRIVTRHILPQLSTMVVTYMGILIAANLLFEAALSFLGIGVLPPVPSWGNIISDGRIFYSTAWWVSFVPGVFIAITVVSLNMLGQQLEEAFDPKAAGGK
jgi:peptide/nickel transport system permease protein